MNKIVVLSLLFTVLSYSREVPQEWFKQNLGDFKNFYTTLHAAPELSLQEKETAQLVASEWEKLGIQVTRSVGGFGVVGVFKNGSGPVLMLRTDLDALPVTENTGLAYQSTKTGVMHACGHDVHMTSLVGAAKYLVQEKKRWKGTLLFVAQPAEEKGSGARAMLKDGLFKKFPKPDFAVALHVTGAMPSGKIGYTYGYAMASADSAEIIMRGKGGHGAMPHKAIDPISMGAKLVLDLQTLVSREVSPTESVVISPGVFQCGTKVNIIPKECKVGFTIRATSEKTREFLQEGIKRHAFAIAKGAGAPDPVIEMSKEGTPALYNDPKLGEKVVAAMKRSMGDENVVEVPREMVSEDFSRYYLEGGVPTFMFRVGSIEKKRFEKLERKDTLPSLHSAEYYPDIEETLPTSIEATVSSAIALLQ